MPYNKYYKQKIQVSLDEGVTWNDVTPAQYVMGGVYEVGSRDCTPPIYRWTDMDISTDYICEYVPPTPVASKVKITYIGGETYEKECDENATLTTGDTKPSEYVYTAMTKVVIGDCVTTIGDNALSGCSALTSVGTVGSGAAVEIPNTVTSIGIGAFRWDTAITNASIPSSVTSIGGAAFQICTALTSVYIPDSVLEIGDYTFDECFSLTSITIPTGVTALLENTFYDCRSLRSVSLPNGITSIGKGAFCRCNSLTGLTIPNSCNEIEMSAFSYCGALTSIGPVGSGAAVIIPNSITNVPIYSFLGCSGLTSVSLPNSITNIDSSSFSDCTSLTNVTIPNSVTYIGYLSFSNCTSLTNVVIPDSVTRIDEKSFSGCTNLSSITVLATTPPRLGKYAFSGNASGRKIYVPSGSLYTYKNATNWRTYAKSIEPIQ